MSKQTVKVVGNRILIKTDEAKAGNLNIDIPTALEVGEVEQIGNAWDLEKEPIKVGDRIHYKSWGCDCITDNGKKYIYICQDTRAICAIVRS